MPVWLGSARRFVDRGRVGRCGLMTDGPGPRTQISERRIDQSGAERGAAPGGGPQPTPLSSAATYLREHQCVRRSYTRRIRCSAGGRGQTVCRASIAARRAPRPARHRRRRRPSDFSANSRCAAEGSRAGTAAMGNPPDRRKRRRPRSSLISPLAGIAGTPVRLRNRACAVRAAFHSGRTADLPRRPAAGVRRRISSRRRCIDDDHIRSRSARTASSGGTERKVSVLLHRRARNSSSVGRSATRQISSSR